MESGRRVALLTGRDGMEAADAMHQRTISLPLSTRRLALESETANQITHAFGTLLAVIGTFFIVDRAWSTGNPDRVVGCAVYGATLIALYAASTLSHSFSEPRLRSFFRMLDQVCIFLLVVGSYTPFGLVHVTSGPLASLLAIMWGLAAIGILFRMFSGNRMVSIACYVALGWMPILTLGRIYEVGQTPGLAMVLGGGLSYTCGTWFLANDDRHPYFHAVWHLMVILGSTFHYLFLLQFVAS